MLTKPDNAILIEAGKLWQNGAKDAETGFFVPLGEQGQWDNETHNL